MIAFLKGRLAHKEATHVIIDVNGVGYEVKISLNTYSKIKSEESCTLLTHFHVKEDAQTLFGFITEAEKKTFTTLIGVNGVGPSTALMILSTLSAEELKHAIVTDDVKMIQKVKGIGAKSAQRIVLELKDKIEKVLGAVVAGTSASPVANITMQEEAVTALITLGYNKLAAEKTIKKILANFAGEISLEELIKQALKSA